MLVCTLKSWSFDFYPWPESFAVLKELYESKVNIQKSKLTFQKTVDSSLSSRWFLLGSRQEENAFLAFTAEGNSYRKILTQALMEPRRMRWGNVEISSRKSPPSPLPAGGTHRKAQQYCTGNPDILGRKEVIGLGKDKSSPDPPPHLPVQKTLL